MIGNSDKFMPGAIAGLMVGFLVTYYFCSSVHADFKATAVHMGAAQYVIDDYGQIQFQWIPIRPSSGLGAAGAQTQGPYPGAASRH
jgi:hypothetical protein